MFLRLEARSLVDAVYDWSRFDSLPRAFEWIRREVEKEDAFMEELIRATIRSETKGRYDVSGRSSTYRGSRNLYSDDLRRKFTHPQASSRGFRIERNEERQISVGEWSLTMSNESGS